MRKGSSGGDIVLKVASCLKSNPTYCEQEIFPRTQPAGDSGTEAASLLTQQEIESELLLRQQRYKRKMGTAVTQEENFPREPVVCKEDS